MRAVGGSVVLLLCLCCCTTQYPERVQQEKKMTHDGGSSKEANSEAQSTLETPRLDGDRIRLLASYQVEEQQVEEQQQSDVRPFSPPVPASFEELVRSVAEQAEQVGFRFSPPTGKVWEVNFSTSPIDAPGDAESAQFGVVTTTEVAMHEAPQSVSKQTAQLPRGSVIEVFHAADRQTLEQHNPGEVKTYDGQYGVEIDGLWNNWYLVKHGGQKGWVFGAYVWRSSSWDSILDKSLSYVRNPPTADFQDLMFLTFKKKVFSQEEKQRFAVERILLEYVSDSEYDLNIDKPDDMASLYRDLYSRQNIPILITTDLALHMFHKLFDSALVQIERDVMIPNLVEFNELFASTLQQLTPDCGGDAARQSLERYSAYICVAARLLEQDVVCPDQVAGLVERELSLIEKASGRDISPIGGFEEDYTQYIVRGHYTVADDLSRYFRAMMWLGRFRFTAQDGLILTQILMQDEQLMAHWEAIFDPISLLVGVADDLTPRDFAEMFPSAIEGDALYRLSDGDLERVLAEVEAVESRQQRVRKGDGVPDGLCLFSQRFTMDAMFFSMLTSPSVGTFEQRRGMPSVVEVTGCLGSTLGREMLRDELEHVVNFEPMFDKCTQFVSELRGEQWFSNVYQAVLGSGRQLLIFPEHTGFPWLDAPMYKCKNFLGFHGVYAELKRDTILYAKQAEAGAGCAETPREYDYKVDPIPTPASYVEPNAPFFAWLLGANQLLSKVLSLTTDSWESETIRRKVGTFSETLAFWRDIATKEAAFEALTESDFKQINTIAASVSYLLQPPGEVISEEVRENMKMPIVADVFTDGEMGIVLEVATGIPYRVYWAVEEPGGGKRVVVGYAYSYYEFVKNTSERMTDQQWRELVYEQGETPDGDLLGKQPEWERKLLIDR